MMEPFHSETSSRQAPSRKPVVPARCADAGRKRPCSGAPSTPGTMEEAKTSAIPSALSLSR